MVSTKYVKRTIQGVLMLAILGCSSYTSTAFTTPSSYSTRTCQSTTTTSFQPPVIGTFRPTPCSSNGGLALFRKPQSKDTPSNNPLMRLRQLLPLRAWFTAFSQVHSKLRRAALIITASLAIWLGTAGSSTPPASAASSSPILERILPQSNDRIIDRYVRQHMFDDDDANHQDPLEAAYREAYDDYETTGAYPRALKEVATQVLGQGAAKQLQREQENSLGFLGVIKGCMRILQRRGLSESTALAVVAGTMVIVAPMSLLFFGMIVGGISKRNMNKLMKKRYGDTYTLDATIKEEPEVEAPDDDDDDDDDE